MLPAILNENEKTLPAIPRTILDLYLKRVSLILKQLRVEKLMSWLKVIPDSLSTTLHSRRDLGKGREDGVRYHTILFLRRTTFPRCDIDFRVLY